MARRRRRWWLVGPAALLLLVGLLASRWSVRPPSPGTSPPGATHFPTTEPLRPAGVAEGSGPSGQRSDVGAAGEAVASVIEDGGVVRGRRLRGHLLIDACEEPLPAEALEPPEGLRVESTGAVRVAYSTEWLEPRDANALAALVAAALEEAAQLLGSDPRDDLLVVTWPDQETMIEAKEGVTWAQAMYDGAVHVTAHTKEHSLRHEVLHAQLHATAPCVPYWLDEGLAGYFEGRLGSHWSTWRKMIRASLWIPFESLAEPLREDEGAEAMEPDEVALLYGQSLGMATLLIENGGPDALERALEASNAGTSRRGLWPFVAPGVGGAQLLAFLARRLGIDPMRPAEASR